MTGEAFLERWDNVMPPYEDPTMVYPTTRNKPGLRCSQCDYLLTNMERFCPYCGQRLVQKSAKEKEFIAGA
jgi:predicted amidophosphoribosyltransferase